MRLFTSICLSLVALLIWIIHKIRKYEKANDLATRVRKENPPAFTSKKLF